MANVLLGVTGSVAAVKTPDLFAALTAAGHTVRVAPTQFARSFFDPADLPAGAPDDPLAVRGQSTVYLDEDEWPPDRRFRVGEPVLHVELRKWADLLLVAPVDGHTLAKLSLGLCDNLLTCVYRAWEMSRPVVLAPAMNTRMWEHPSTSRHLCQLLEDHGGRNLFADQSPDGLSAAINDVCPRLRVVPPQSKVLACGDEGMGGMADVADIVKCVNGLLAP